MARRFLRLFVGDVAIYISAHTANRFHEARGAIQREAFAVARHVYGLRDEGPDGVTMPYYDRVLFVGHSLGSVIAYDTLNAMLRSQIYAREGDRILERTRGLVTFGSPLDKTAYIFRGQPREDFALREVLAATWQPLIRKYRYRPPSWINIWSRHDPISGSLDYYDEPGETLAPDRAKRVENREDPDATTPVLAHNEYWTGRLLGEVLLEEITCDDEPPPFLA
jgi:pimeloyl-ACP methyl ester carboxylesterase